MTDRQLKYIVAIAEAGSISLAAKRLYISQPSLSSLLSHVEDEIGVLLFDRDTSPLKPTYAGEQYITAAKQILGIQRNLDSHFADIRHGKEGRLVLGVGSKLLTHIFPKLIPVFMLHNPGIQIEIVEGSVDYLTEKLHSNEVDAVISNHVINLPNVSSRIISHQRMAIYTPRGLLTGLNANNDADFDLSLMRDEPFALVTTSYQREIINTIFLRYNISPNILIESSSWELCLSAVDHGLASTILPATSIHDDKESACRDTLILPEEYAFDTSVYYKARYYDTDLIERFIQECASLII